MRLAPEYGLSPRERGNPVEDPGPEPGLRSIPARAGEPGGSGTTARRLAVYPRASGGTRPTAGLSTPSRGLSPRERGNRDRRTRLDRWHGSIPARAGEPATIAMPRGARAVYPRASGGTRAPPPMSSAARGLSPRERGNRSEHLGLMRYLGSIPARAGEPRCPQARLWPGWVYPRASGGTHCHVRIPFYSPGLSPRERGNRKALIAAFAAPWSIPARAGEPHTGSRSVAATRVYPRASGGTSVAVSGVRQSEGLSPRERGNRVAGRLLDVQRRSIPARAGEPT